jgi:excisionase family DNA binding protein
MSASVMTDEKIYTVQEVATILRVTPRTVRNMIVSGEIEAFPVRDQYRITQRALEKFMQRRARKGDK